MPVMKDVKPKVIDMGTNTASAVSVGVIPAKFSIISAAW
jgi:hypothetical protein